MRSSSLFTPVTEHIARLQLRYFVVPVNVWLVREDAGATLIDAGGPGNDASLIPALRNALAGTSLRQIVLTHAHIDHAGALLKVLEAYPETPVICHADETDLLSGPRRYAQLSAGHWQYRLSPSLPPMAPGLRAFRTLSDGDHIAGMRVVHVPGHTPGQIALWHIQDRAIVCGDCYMNMLRLSGPFAMASYDLIAARASMRRVAGLDFDHLLVSHGPPLMGDGRARARRLVGM